MAREIVILGGGVIGLSAAYYCARRGFQVTLVERGPALRDGCSFGNAGMIVPSHFTPLAAPGAIKLALKWMFNPVSPFYLKPRFDTRLFSWGMQFWRASTAEHVNRAAPLLRDLLLAGRKGFEEFEAEHYVGFGLVKRGLLMLCHEEHTLDEEALVAERARALGVSAEVLDAKQTAALDPGVRMNIVGSVYFPLDCHLTTHRFMSVLQSAVEKSGVVLRWNTEARSAELQSNGRIRALVAAGGEKIPGDEFIMCGGSWTGELALSLGLKIPLQAGKGYSLTLPTPRQVPELCSICTEARVAVTPMDGSLRVGGTMEIAGLEESINPVRVRGIVDSFCRYFPEFQPQDFAGIKPWRGLRPCSPDGLPFIGRTRRYANLTFATGHGMMGLSLAPVTGKMVAGILSGERPEWDISMLSPDRYA